ncbi:MAG: hypothetical protein FJX76_19325 [Armatimonadetes bacterium]|nr:hypothetical protein [Armatimonadota bacterium]
MLRPLKVLLGGAALLAGAAEIAMRKRGDTDILLDVTAAREFTRTSVGPEQVRLHAVVPFIHRGKQQGCVLDCTARVLPDGDRYDGLDFEVKVSNLSLPRNDGYFEAIMYKTNEKLDLGLEIEVRGKGDVWQRLQDLGHLLIEFRYCFYMRSPLHYRRAVLVYQMKRTSAAGNGKGSGEVAASSLGGGGTAVDTAAPPRAARARKVGVAQPVRTHLLTPQDRFVEVLEKYVAPHAKPGDVVAVAESALAIMQNRLHHVEDIQPRFLAQKLCRLLDPDSSLSTPYGLEMAFQVCGAPRILAAFVAGVAGKVMGRSGDFYRVAGPDVACIDDASGTLPPFDKYVVLGPVDCQNVVNDVKKRLGLEAAVVDANDLKKCYVVAVSDPSLEKFVVDALIDNPQGNAGEQTPIVIIPRSE